jgi:hypothetical protein
VVAQVQKYPTIIHSSSLDERAVTLLQAILLQTSLINYLLEKSTNIFMLCDKAQHSLLARCHCS